MFGSPVRTLVAPLLLVCLGAGLGSGLGCNKARTSEPGPDQEFAGLGVVGANSELPPGMFLPIAPGDLDAVTARGRLLHAMQSALQMGWERGALAVGVPQGEVVMPVVDVDPGERSAQVVFVRWPSTAIPEEGRLEPSAAQRWLLVSMLLEPARLLDVELIRGPVDEGDGTYERVQSLLVAAERLAARTPGRAYGMFTVDEILPAADKRVGKQVATRVYALGAEPGGPDFEFLVQPPPRRGKPPVLLEEQRIHEEGALAGAAPHHLDLHQPSPATVARVLARGSEAAPVRVETQSGTWEISPRDGRIARATEARAGY